MANNERINLVLHVLQCSHIGIKICLYVFSIQLMQALSPVEKTSWFSTIHYILGPPIVIYSHGFPNGMCFICHEPTEVGIVKFTLSHCIVQHILGSFHPLFFISHVAIVMSSCALYSSTKIKLKREERKIPKIQTHNTRILHHIASQTKTNTKKQRRGSARRSARRGRLQGS